jgi:hypothetical protein
MPKSAAGARLIQTCTEAAETAQDGHPDEQNHPLRRNDCRLGFKGSCA